MTSQLLLLMACLCAPWAAGQEAKRPNILVITTDQQFADVMSCAGSDGVKTPAMDAITKKGVRFTNAYANYPVCMPQRYSIYTGRLPCTRRDADKKNKPTISLGNQARKAGYATAYFGKWHIQEQTFGAKDSTRNGFDLYSGGKDVTMTDNAIAYLGGKHPKPFLAVVSYYNPHDICEWGRKKAGFTDDIAMRNGEVPTDPDLERCPPLPDNFEINADESAAVADRRRSEKKGIPGPQKMAMDFSKAPSHPYVVTEAEVQDSPGGDYEGRSVRSEKFKYHVWNRGEQREQLFDMLHDPGETTNLAGRKEFEEELNRHRAMLADWLKRTDDNFKAL